MASWILVPCLVSLRSEFNALAPGREKASDGSIGDQAHADRSSDHNPDETGATPTEDADNINEVHAIDVDKDLNRSGWSMQRAVEIIVTRHRTGRDDRLQNVIYSRRIWSASWGWTAREYTGSNPHDHHAHFGSKYTPNKENDTRPWGLLEEDDVALDNDDKQWLLANLGPQAVASKISADLNNTATGIAKGVADRTEQGVAAFFWAAKASTAQNEEPYKSASADEQRAMRNARQIVQAVTGGPVDGAAIMGAIQAVSPDTNALASALLPQISAEIEARMAEARAASEAHFNSLYQEINEVPLEVIQALANPDTPDEEVARALSTLLGGRRAAVAALLQAA